MTDFKSCIDHIYTDFITKHGYMRISHLIAYYFLDSATFAVVNYRLSRYLQACKLERIALFIMKLTERLAFVSIPYSVVIGRGLRINHGLNIVIGGKAVLGEYCTIHQGVTIGGNFHDERRNTSGDYFSQPVIGDYVHLGAGCAVLGPVIIGSHVVIGANTVVTEDVPDYSIVLTDRRNIIKRLEAENSKHRERFDTVLPNRDQDSA